MPPCIQIHGGVIINGGTNMVRDDNGTAFQYNGSDGSYMEYATSMDDPVNIRVFNGNGGVQVSTFTDERGRIITQCHASGNNGASQNVHTTNAIFAQPEMQRAFEETIQERQSAARDQQRAARDHQHAARDLQHAARDQQRAARDHQRAARDEQSAEDPWNSWPLNQGPRPPPWMTGGDPTTFWQGRNGPASHAPSGAGDTRDFWEQDWMSDGDSEDDFDFRGCHGPVRGEIKMEKMRRKMAKMQAKVARLEARVGPPPHHAGCIPPAAHVTHAAYAARPDGSPAPSASPAHVHPHVQTHSIAAPGTSSTTTRKTVPRRSLIEKLRAMGPSILERLRDGDNSKSH